ncbi:hypothetical protein STRDD11_01157 [Streptococcus sp. DD11]|uniref:tetratricopeptide repeat protein n=1 Tax=Streptococcus sp. DD11 TaxID=1777879 RepID=UPI0007936D5B|nr:tetratricopeptide repeat protein [Streptococcus sp. DD11]KXT84055.1 hypothetical protein STRDD11_01157 [Streptococcus sp. DD11]
MDEPLKAAWQAFFEGNLDLAAKLEGELTGESFSSLHLRAYLAVEAKDFSRAAKTLQTYLARAQAQSDKENEHVAYHQLGYVARSAGDFLQALEWIEKEAAFLARHFPEDHYRQSVNLYEQGYIKLKLGQTNQAEKLLQQALTYALETDDLINQACAYRGLGEMNQAIGKGQAARCNFAAAIRLFEQAGDTIGQAEAEKLLASCV